MEHILAMRNKQVCTWKIRGKNKRGKVEGERKKKRHLKRQKLLLPEPQLNKPILKMH